MIYQVHYHPAATPETDHTAVELELVDDVARPARMRSFGNLPLELAPGQERVAVTDTHALPWDGAEAVGVRLHMHTLGSDGRIAIERGGESTCALHVPRWDFEWQLFYYFDEPIPLARGDQLELTCAYDTRSRDSVTTWGASTEDEMCLGYLLVTEPD